MDLKKFVGSSQQFKTEEGVKKIISTSKNDELKNLLLTHRIAEKIGSGYSIRPIFLCNVTANQDAKDYLAHAAAVGLDIDLWDLREDVNKTGSELELKPHPSHHRYRNCHYRKTQTLKGLTLALAESGLASIAAWFIDWRFIALGLLWFAKDPRQGKSETGNF